MPFRVTDELDEPPSIPPDSPIRDLKARLESVPKEVPAGDDLVFVAVLENPTEEAVILDPCPAYDINFGESSEVVSSGLRLLNCEGGDRIPAGGSLPFEMRLSTASDEIRPDGYYTLVWRLDPWLTGEVTHLSTT